MQNQHEKLSKDFDRTNDTSFPLLAPNFVEIAYLNALIGDESYRVSIVTNTVDNDHRGVIGWHIRLNDRIYGDWLKVTTRQNLKGVRAPANKSEVSEAVDILKDQVRDVLPRIINHSSPDVVWN